MTTACIALPPMAWYPPDDSSGSASAQLQMKVTSDASDPQARWPEWLFDPTTNEHIYTTFVVPADYSSDATLKVYYKMTSATSGNIIWGGLVMCMTDADAADMDADEFDAANVSATITVPGTAGYLDVATITLTNANSITASDNCVIAVYRDAATDSATGDAELVNVEFQYTLAA